MTEKRPVNNDEELVAVLGDAIDTVDSPNEPDEVNAFLKDCGHDPEEVGRQTSAFVDQLIAGVRETATAEREMEQARFEGRAVQLDLPATRSGLLDAIGRLLRRRGPELSAQYRNFDKQTDNDLRELLRVLTVMDESKTEDPE